MLDKIMNWLREKKWIFSKVDNENVLFFQFELKDKQIIQCIFDVDDKEKVVLFYSILPQTIPTANKSKAFRLLHQLNYNLLLGNFEFDHTKNQIRFKTSFYYGQNLPDNEVLERNVHANIDSMRYSLLKFKPLLDNKK